MSNKIDLALPFSEIRRVKNLVYDGAAVSLAKAREAAPDADIIINTALFDMATGKIMSRVVADGVQHGGQSDWAQTWGVAFAGGKTPTLSWDNGVKAPEFIGPYSSAVYNGEIGDGLGETWKRGRTAIGIAGDKLVILCVPDKGADRMTTAAVCRHMKDRGCTFAINLDGGGSSQFVAPDGSSYSSGRKCPAWLAIWLEHDETDDSAPKESGVRCVCTKRTYTLDGSGRAEIGRYIAVGDVCTLEGITADCLVRVTYPTSRGTRTAYIKSLEGFKRL